MRKLLIVTGALILLAGWVWPEEAASRRTWKPTKAQVVAAKKIRKPVLLTNSVGMKFVLIPAGSFVMGSPPHEPKREENEGPQHRVVISRPFYMQATEVTQAQYCKVMGENPSHFKGCDRCPVEQVAWVDAMKFIRRLNALEKEGKYRLPTEAEWEYACRAGTRTAYSFGNRAGLLWAYAWYSENSGNRTHPVATRRPNRWGLFDMHGNILEWCSDRYGKDYYRKSPTRDPKGSSSGTFRVVRGGDFQEFPWFLRSAWRDEANPCCANTRANGFRVVRDF